MNFAVSTTAFRGLSVEAILELAREHNLQIEFSSGLPYRADMEEVFRKAACRRLPHNYFPAPKDPFVLNLASLNEEIFRKSIDHCKRGLQLASATAAPFFSVHAGFCLDPAPQSLGRPLGLTPQHPREMHWERFLKALRELLPEAKQAGVRLLIENNVLAPFNYVQHRVNPVLCADAYELTELMKAFPGSELGILIDTGHLKVSAQTLGFQAEEALLAVSFWVKAFHHSDNDGQEDTNGPIGFGYWFLDHAHRFTDAWHILEVHDQSVEQIQRQFELIRGYAVATTN